MPENNNSDRVIAILIGLILVVIGITGFVFANGFWRTLLWLLWMVFLIGWWYSGWTGIKIGHGAILTFFGERQIKEVAEGAHWAPYPWSYDEEDLRDKVVELSPVKAFTKDNVEVEGQVTIKRRIDSINKYRGVEPSGVQKWLDDVRDEVFRDQVKDEKLSEVLKMQEQLKKEIHEALGKDKSWGIEITEVTVFGLRPTNLQVQADLELRERENLQRQGQSVEARHTISLIELYMKPVPEGGAGMTLEKATEQANLVTGKANPRNLTAFSLNSEIVAAAKEILGRK